ncbi:hypothetical protein C943_02785 [Mariniradius saccharolyticus AK6]|uniref:Uncharacterized protein n=1 Tax=Mariniradius saccharolyticus AK6 TaxID=1239962 RepID=M7X871_9BACT|nr:hypothetical protein C943_02785 [Mariniradius saccharolyticus AK6]
MSNFGYDSLSKKITAYIFNNPKLLYYETRFTRSMEEIDPRHSHAFDPDVMGIASPFPDINRHGHH